MTAPITPVPSWFGAPIPCPTTGDKIRQCETRIGQLQSLRQQALTEIAFQKAQLEAIDTDLTNQENRLLYLEEQELDERYGVPTDV
jgi:predicted Zn-dependent protease